MELLGAAGHTHPEDVTPAMIHRRISAETVRTLDELIDWLEPGELVGGRTHRPAWQRWLDRSRADRFVATAG